ncbi:hypothetical protein LX36DRAFT_705176 [Colletotrichum falcatum]|nr:hypothetical protein LX36DRAFT_705176 [Colletotrichum falcatum]
MPTKSLRAKGISAAAAAVASGTSYPPFETGFARDSVVSPAASTSTSNIRTTTVKMPTMKTTTQTPLPALFRPAANCVLASTKPQLAPHLRSATAGLGLSYAALFFWLSPTIAESSNTVATISSFCNYQGRIWGYNIVSAIYAQYTKDPDAQTTQTTLDPPTVFWLNLDPLTNTTRSPPLATCLDWDPVVPMPKRAVEIQEPSKTKNKNKQSGHAETRLALGVGLVQRRWRPTSAGAGGWDFLQGARSLFQYGGWHLFLYSFCHEYHYDSYPYIATPEIAPQAKRSGLVNVQTSNAKRPATALSTPPDVDEGHLRGREERSFRQYGSQQAKPNVVILLPPKKSATDAPYALIVPSQDPSRT